MASAMRTDVAEADAEALDGFDPEQVDMMAEAVILVDEMDRPLGRASKVNAHRGAGAHGSPRPRSHGPQGPMGPGPMAPWVR